MLNARLFSLPVGSTNANEMSAELQRPPIDHDPAALNNERLTQLLDEHRGTSWASSR
jgi:hypothetical protein